jgi:hypothetical protein
MKNGDQLFGARAGRFVARYGCKATGNEVGVSTRVFLCGCLTNGGQKVIQAGLDLPMAIAASCD